MRGLTEPKTYSGKGKVWEVPILGRAVTCLPPSESVEGGGGSWGDVIRQEHDCATRS